MNLVNTMAVVQRTTSLTGTANVIIMAVIIIIIIIGITAFITNNK